MTTELNMLFLSALFTSLLWVPYILNRLFEFGILRGLWDPEGDTRTSVGWARRLMAAHGNAVENLVVFAPLVIILHLLDVSTEATQMACIVFLYSRVAHAVLFTLRVPVLRIIAFLSGFAAQMTLALAILRAAA